MKKIILFSLIQIVCVMEAFAQNSPWKANGQAIPARPNLDVRWMDSTKFPRKVWVYTVLPNKFSPEITSEVRMLCCFGEKDKIQDDASGITYSDHLSSRSLSISFSSGKISYETSEINYSQTNLAIGVPSTNDLLRITQDVLSKLHIKPSEITGWLGTNKIDFSEPITYYFVGHATITNVPYRTAYFRRAVDEMPIIGNFYRINVGEHGRICKLSITWPNLKKIKSYKTVSIPEVITFLRTGNAIRGPVPMNVGDLDWLSIKSITVKKAVPSYQIFNNQLYPLLCLDVAVDTGREIVVVAMDCPLIDETKL